MITSSPSSPRTRIGARVEVADGLARVSRTGAVCYSLAVSAPNKRDTDRAQLLGGLRGEVMVYRSVTITQISRAGAQVATRFPLRLDSLHDFRLTLGERFVVVKGRVAYCEIDDADPDLASYRSGVQFIEPSEQVATVIAEFVASIESDEITR